MNHDFYGPGWADNHDKLSDAVAALVGSAGAAFAWLHTKLFAAPWHRPARHVRLPIAK